MHITLVFQMLGGGLSTAATWHAETITTNQHATHARYFYELACPYWLLKPGQEHRPLYQPLPTLSMLSLLFEDDQSVSFQFTNRNDLTLTLRKWKVLRYRDKKGMNKIIRHAWCTPGTIYAGISTYLLSKLWKVDTHISVKICLTRVTNDPRQAQLRWPTTW